MDIAFEQARAAGSRDEVPVGAVVVRDGVVIAAAGNRTRELSDPTAHAEILAIRAAASTLGSQRLVGCDLYVTLEPCPMCAAAISFARIRTLHWGADDPKGGAVISGVKLYEQPTCHHAPALRPGEGAAESAAMLKAFFRARRATISTK